MADKDSIMAQPKVMEYFSNRKRRTDSHPAKRQKLSEPAQLVKVESVATIIEKVSSLLLPVTLLT